ncbi:MAG: hypothetical protein ACR2N4_15480 [Jatrophihabitans sp.]
MLGEPVTRSCDWLDAAAPHTCRSEVGTCDWYHGTWQYLRLLNLVSNPGWHSEFLIERIAELGSDRASLDVLVSGCADYSTYAHAAAALGPRLNATALDWCWTPLIATRWYAREIGLQPPLLLRENALIHQPADAYDLIISDSFLPRFSSADLVVLVAAWRRSLRPGGTVITTVRIHDENSVQAARSGSQAELWRQVAQDSWSWWPAVSRLPVAELADKVAGFAQQQERNAVYAVAQLAELFEQAGFAELESNEAVINGKRFARLVVH